MSLKKLLLPFFMAFGVLCLIVFAQESDIKYFLTDYDLSRSRSFKIPIPEASGVAVDFRNNYMYIHDDSGNLSNVYVFNTDGTLINTIELTDVSFYDWEDITTDRAGLFWIIDSRKKLIEFQADIEGKLVPDSVKMYDLPSQLVEKNVESLDYLPEEDAFIAIFKEKEHNVYKFKRGEAEATLISYIPSFLRLKPSGLTHHPKNGNFYMIAFRGHKIVELSPDFQKVIGTFNIPLAHQFQPEAIDFDKHLNLIFASEKNWFSSGGKSKVTILFNNKFKEP